MIFPNRGGALPVDLSAPLDWTHGLNAGRIAWWLALPQYLAGGTWRDLCRGRIGTLVAYDSSNRGWRGATRAGGGGCLNSDGGATSYVQLPSGLFPSTVLSVAAWARIENTSNYQGIFSAFTGNDDGMEIFVNAGTNLFGGNFGNQANSATSAVAVGQWYRVLVTSDGATTRLYINGRASLGNTGTTNFATFGVAPTIGTRGPYTFIGGIDDVSLWSRCLSPADVWSDYSLSLQGYPGVLRRVRRPVFFSSGATSFSYTPTGGLSLGGTAAPSATLRGTASGGAILGGTAPATLGLSATPSGGIALAGSSSPSATLRGTASGGLIAGGAASPGATLTGTSAGGIVLAGAASPSATLSGTASGGIILSGSASPGLAFAPAPSGGVVLGGSAVPTGTNNFTATASGGLVLAGTSAPSATLTGTATGGIVLGGTAVPTAGSVFTATASGGIVIGGSSSPSAAFSFAPSGGLSLSGAATPALTFIAVASGGITLSGTAAYDLDLVATPTVLSADEWLVLMRRRKAAGIVMSAGSGPFGFRVTVSGGGFATARVIPADPGFTTARVETN